MNGPNDDGEETDPFADPELNTRNSTALNLTGASIRDSSYPGEPGDPAPVRRGAPSIILPHQEASYVRHIALDIGGSLIKLVYFSPDSQEDSTTTGAAAAAAAAGAARHGHSHGNGHGHHPKGGRMHFVKFETARIDDCLDFITAKGLHRCMLKDGSSREVRVKATGGGAIRFADVFKERLGLVLEREDEIGCAVGGCNFLLRTITHEAFAFEAGQAQFVPCSAVDSELFPYLLVNIGSGVSIIRVDGPGEADYCRISGSSVGGGTFWGLCRLLTGLRDFDAMLELSMQGNNANVDMLVGDIYGGRDYSSIGLSASTIACSFGKVVGQDKELGDYNPADVAMSLCRMVAYNIGQLAFMHAKRYDLKRVFFGGFFIRGHPYTMETISFAIKFWSQGEMSALFLRHEGFLGAVGAFLKVHPMHVPSSSSMVARAAALRGGEGGPGAAGGCGGGVSVQSLSDAGRSMSTKVRARFVERFSMGAPFAGGEVRGPAIRDMSDRVSWVEKFVAVGQSQAAQAQQEQEQQQRQQQQLLAHQRSYRFSGGVPTPSSPSPSAAAAAAAAAASQLDRSISMPMPYGVGGDAGGGGGQPASPTFLPTRIPLHVGVLHYSPTQEPFPLLADPASYTPNTIDINTDEAEYKWLLQVLGDQVPTVVEKAVKSEGGGDGPRRRAAAFGRAFTAHIQKLRQDPGAYGQLGLSDLFEMREECLREFGFSDVYRLDKEAENDVALQVLPDLLTELDGMEQRERLLALVQGILAANIFDWGAKACVELYTNGTILDIYREARRRLSKRPWRVDDFDDFMARVYGPAAAAPAPAAAAAAAAIGERGQLGGSSEGQQHIAEQMQQQLDKEKAEEQEAVSDGSAVPDSNSPFCSASAVAGAAAAAAGSTGSAGSSMTQLQQQQQQAAAPPPPPGAAAAGGSVPPFRRVMVFVDNAGADIVLGMLPFVREMLRLGCEVVMVANSLPAINDITAAELRSLLSAAAEVCPIIKASRAAALTHEAPTRGALAGGPSIPPYPGLRQRQSSTHDLLALASSAGGAGSSSAAGAAAGAVGRSGSSGGSGASSSAFGSPLSSMDGAGLTAASAAAGGGGTGASSSGVDALLVQRPPPSASQQQQQELASVGFGADNSTAHHHQHHSSGSSSSSSSLDDAGAASPPPPRQAAAAAPGSGGGGAAVSPAAVGQGGAAAAAAAVAAAGGGGGAPHVVVVEPKLFVLGNGSGSPCLDLSRVPAALADATVGVDLLVIEGMGRAIHTNLRTPFKCDTLKLAMIKTERLAVKLFGGSLYDCMCSFQRAPLPPAAQAAIGTAAAAGGGAGGGAGGSEWRQR